jgi:hypothetical protein
MQKEEVSSFIEWQPHLIRFAWNVAEGDQNPAQPRDAPCQGSWAVTDQFCSASRHDSPPVCFPISKNRQAIPGIILDTPWRALRPYAHICSIVTLRIRNAGVQITLSFGPAEDADLYDKVFIAFMEVRSMDQRELSVPVFSDQRFAL